MGCFYSLCYYPLGNIVYVIEKIASCCALAAIISCIVATLTIMLGMGVGLGYNYCYVDYKIHEAMTTTTIHPLRSRDGVLQFSEHRKQLKTSNNENRNRQINKAVTVKPTIVIPLKDHIDLALLISKIQKAKKNITLELIT